MIITHLMLVVRYCIREGNATAAYVYARMLARYARQSGALKPTLDNDAAWRLREMTRVLLLNGYYTEADARRVARQVLGE